MHIHTDNIMRIYLLLFLFAGSISAPVANAQLLGFDETASASQQAIEVEFDEHIDAADMDSWLKTLSSEPHHVGSIKGLENARFLAELFESWGYQTEIAEYQILFPVPVTRELEMLSPQRYTATLQEDSLAEDPSTLNIDDLLPPYNAFSTDGEVEGELVFVNYGTPADYEVLERYGIDVTGKIAIAKYGGSWRGIKPKLAGEKGAIATIIYSDPADDGYGRGDAYPDGPFKHESGVQRGSVMDMPTYPGDVLTPGIGATADAKRLDRADAPTITKIPVLPISHRDALPLLAAMEGCGSTRAVERCFAHYLPLRSRAGPGAHKTRIQLANGDSL